MWQRLADHPSDVEVWAAMRRRHAYVDHCQRGPSLFQQTEVARSIARPPDGVESRPGEQARQMFAQHGLAVGDDHRFGCQSRSPR